MGTENHTQLAGFIWSICNLLRGPYKRNEYRKVILPLTVLRRFDCILEPTKAAVLKEHAAIKAKPENIIRNRLSSITKHSFYNLSKFTLGKPPEGSGFNGLLDDPNQLAPNLNSYINGFSPNVRAIMERFKFADEIATMAEKDLLYLVVKSFAAVDLAPHQVDNVQMGYVFEELIRIGAEQTNEEAGEHFTPREVIKLMVNLLLAPEKDLARSHVVKTIYDPACGTGGMLSVAEKYIRDLNADAQPKLFGQDWNDEAWAVCKSDMLIKGEDADAIILGDTFTKDGFDRDANGKKWTFDYMLANPPFGVEWKQQQRYIENERDTLGFSGRFGAGTPRVNDGALPTRFMDWTTNPLVALYFAARETESDENDKPVNSAVYVLISEPKRLTEINRPKTFEVKPVQDTETKSAAVSYYEQFGDQEDPLGTAAALDKLGFGDASIPRDVRDLVRLRLGEALDKEKGNIPADQQHYARSKTEVISPFEISENVIYDPPHVSPRIRAQDGVLMACYQPMKPLEEADYLEIVVKHEAHDDIRRRLDQYGVFDKQLFPDLDGIAKWLKYRVFEIDGKC